MATEAQIAANSRNALRSTGPKTLEGKRIVSQNALRHGLLASDHYYTTRTQRSLLSSPRTSSSP